MDGNGFVKELEKRFNELWERDLLPSAELLGIAHGPAIIPVLKSLAWAGCMGGADATMILLAEKFAGVPTRKVETNA